MRHSFDADTIVLGMGSAGLLAAIELTRRAMRIGMPTKTLLVGRMSGGASVLSSWYVAQYDEHKLFERMIAGLGESATHEQLVLARYVAEHHIAETERFKREVMANAGVGGIKEFVNGFSGIKSLTGFSSEQALPGARILRYLRERAEALGVRRVIATIDDLERIDGGYRVRTSSQRGQIDLFARRIIVATGGMAHTKEYATSAIAYIKNVIELARDRLDVAVHDIERAVYFPFSLREKGYRDGSLLPPSFMTRADIWEIRPDGMRIDPLNDRLKGVIASGDYRPIFSELVTLFQQLRQGGSSVVVETRMTRSEFEHYRTTDHYGYVFKDKPYEEARRIAIAPAYHTALGGIVIDSGCRTSDPCVYAVGESALVYGTDRPIGGEHVSAITLAPVVAQALIEQSRTAGLFAFSRNRALEDARRDIDRADSALVCVVERFNLARAATAAVPAPGTAVRRVVEAVLATTAERLPPGAFQRSLRRPLADTFAWSLEDCALEAPPSQQAWRRDELVHALAALGAHERDELLNAIADRLATTLPIAREKARAGLPIRDAARELEVVDGAVAQAAEESAGFVEALYREIVLPSAFAMQHVLRQAMAHSLSASAGRPATNVASTNRTAATASPP